METEEQRVVLVTGVAGYWGGEGHKGVGELCQERYRLARFGAFRLPGLRSVFAGSGRRAWAARWLEGWPSAQPGVVLAHPLFQASKRRL